MKFKKLMMITIILVTILSISAVSATDNVLSATDNADTISANNKEIYVDTSGSDTGSGSQSSPYATINKAISDVNASDNAIIHLGAGTYSGEDNTNLEINKAHTNYNGSLTIIGAGNGMTIIDGGDEAAIISSISADSIVTLINITFTHGRAELGSAITSSGTLTIDNCIFHDNEATNLAAVYQKDDNNLTIKNSKFYNNKAEKYADIYCDEYNLVVLINNIFENSTVTNNYADSPSVYIGSAKSIIRGNTFKNLQNSRSAAALCVRYNNGENIANITDNTFINCNYTGSNGGIIFFQNAYLKNNTLINCSSTAGMLYSNTDFNAHVTLNDVEITGTHFILTGTVTDDMGNSVEGAKVNVYLNNVKVGQSNSDKDGFVSVAVDKLLDNGEYIISAVQAYDDTNPFDCTINEGKATVNFDHSPIDLWVSTTGNDETGDGSENNPFLTLKHALDYGVSNSVDITVHMKDGVYNETGDYDLSYSNVLKITIIGESYGKTVIDALNSHRFFTAGVNTELLFRNLKFVNGAGTSSRSFDVRYLTMENCIVNNSQRFYAQNSPSHIVFKNLTWINSANLMIYDPEIYNSYFGNINSSGTGNLWLATTGNDKTIIIENTKFVNLTCTGYSGCGVAYISGGNFRSINNTFDSCVAEDDYGVFSVSAVNTISINDTFINNKATNFGVAVFNNKEDNPSVKLINDKFINNTATENGGAISIYGGEIINCLFENNVAGGNGGAIFLASHYSSTNLYDLKLNNVTFKNNSADNGQDIYIEQTRSNYAHSNLENMNVTFRKALITKLQDTVYADVTHDSGAIIGGGAVDFYLDGSFMGTATVKDGVAALDYIGFTKNGTYSLSGNYDVGSSDTIYKNSTLIVMLEPLKENITLYVSDSKGDDENGDGSQQKPYKTIETAIINGIKESPVVVVNVLEGNYSGELNTNITVFSSLDITIAGEGQNKTIIDGRDLDWFLNVKAGQGIVKIANMTIANITKNYVDARLYGQMPAITIEKFATVSLDNVGFTRCHGTEGGAILSNGTLMVNNSYFFNNGDSNYGAAIKNYGDLTVYNSTFIANHAKYYSTIYNDGNLLLADSIIQDSMRVNGWTGNAMVMGGSGNITMINSTILRSGKTSNELIGTGQTWANNPGFAISIGSTGIVKVINSTIDGHNKSYSAQYISNVAFGGSGSIGVFVPYGLEVVDTRILNLKDVITNSKGTNFIDSCYIENVTYICEGTSYDYNVTVVNSYFADGTTMLTKKATANVTLNDNWWGNNSQPVYKVGSTDTNPDTWLILTLNATDNLGLIQDAVLAFKVYDGENVTDYDGSLYPREFTMTATNATLEQSNGTITSNVINPLKGTENQGYYLEATVDGQTVNYASEDKLAIGNATIVAEDVSLIYGENQINVSVVSEQGAVNIGNITLRVNKKTYSSEVVNGTATFNIEVLPVGDYDLEYSFAAENVFNPTSNASKLSVTLPKSVTNSTFFYFFDEKGNLRDYVTGDLVFEGEFENLGVDNLVINSPIKLTGNNATLNNIGIDIVSDNVTVEGFTFISDELGDVINVEGDNAVINKNVFDVTAPENEDSRVIHVEADNVKITDNNIDYVSNNDEGVINRVIDAKDSSKLNVSDNVISAEIPATTVNWTSNTKYSIGLSFDDCDNLTLDNNEIEVISNSGNDTYDTIYAVDVRGDDAVIKGNTITVDDAPYNYALMISGDEFTVDNNTIFAGDDDVYSCGIEIDGPSTGVVNNNRINAASDSAYGVYSSDWAGDISVDYTNNEINIDAVSGFGLSVTGDESTIANNTIVMTGNYTTGIASMVEDLVVDNNNILANGSDEGTPAGYDMMGIETTGVHIVTGDATITNNNITSNGEFSIDDGGTGSITNNVLKARNFTGDASVDYTLGDVSVSNNTPKMNKAIISSDNIVMYYRNGTRYVIVLTDGQGNPLANETVTFYINGMNYTRVTNANGTTSIPLNLPVGNYTLSAVFAGNADYPPVNATNKLTILSTISGEDIVKIFKNGTQYYASFTDAHGNPLANTTVQFNINGVFYNRTTNANGTAKMNINLPAGKYIITATNFINNQTFANNITVLSSIKSDDLVKYYKNESQYYATFVDGEGNPLVNATVQFNINGVFYNRKTNENGTAKLNINLPAGKYIISVTNPVNGEVASNNIEVLPTLSAKDLIKVRGSSDQFIANVVDGHGNPLSNVSVQFNINGVFYYRTTNGEGNARLNINLPAGQYIITSSYNGASIANKVTVVNRG